MTLAATVAVSGTGPLLLTGVVTLDEAAHFISREIIGLLFGMFRSIAALTAAGFFAHLALYPRAGVRTVIPLGFFIRIVRAPTVVVLGCWIVLQVIMLVFPLSRLRRVARFR